ncbi:MAG: hypothetical protein ABIO04_00590 [Ferruginibacter sp.]
MTRIIKKILLFSILTGTMLVSFADRGVGKKSKSKIMLNINTNNSFKTSFNINAGMKYRGSLLTNVQKQNTSLNTTELITYQKGSSIYIVPYKPKVIVPEVKQGYTGIKLIIKTN